MAFSARPSSRKRIRAVFDGVIDKGPRKELHGCKEEI